MKAETRSWGRSRTQSQSEERVFGRFEASISGLRGCPGQPGPMVGAAGSGATGGASVQPDNGPRLSIIISCFNYRDYVARAIESVLRQEDRRCELLVVDDGSTDGSWDIIRSYAVPKSFRLANGGALRACLHALSHAEAPFMLFLDADCSATIWMRSGRRSGCESGVAAG